MTKGNLPTGRLYILVFDAMQDLNQSVQLVSDLIFVHVTNHHSSPKRKHAEQLTELEKMVSEYININIQIIETNKPRTAEADEKFNSLNALLNRSLDNLIIDVQKDEIGNRMGLLQTKLLLELKDIIDSVKIINSLYQDLESSVVEKSKPVIN